MLAFIKGFIEELSVHRNKRKFVLREKANRQYNVIDIIFLLRKAADT